MMQELQIFFQSVQLEQYRTELVCCNRFSEQYGLSLSEAQMEQLAVRHIEALRASGRVEFGTGVLEKLVHAFCDSPYLVQENYADTLTELQELFYHLKTDCMERVSDDELVEAMQLIYNEAVHGDLTGLMDADRDTIYRIVRIGSLCSTLWEQESTGWNDE